MGGIPSLRALVAVAPSAAVVVISTPPPPSQTAVVSGTVAVIAVLAGFAVLAVLVVLAGFAIVAVVAILAGLAVVRAVRAASAVLTAVAVVGTAATAVTPTGCQTAGVVAASAIVGTIIVSCVGERGDEILYRLTAVFGGCVSHYDRRSIREIRMETIRMLHSSFYPFVTETLSKQSTAQLGFEPSLTHHKRMF